MSFWKVFRLVVIELRYLLQHLLNVVGPPLRLDHSPRPAMNVKGYLRLLYSLYWLCGHKPRVYKARPVLLVHTTWSANNVVDAISARLEP